jgi:hypothetical protein
MAHAISGGAKGRHALIRSKAILFWITFAIFGLIGSYALDRLVGSSADLASLTLPNDGQLEGDWVSGSLQLHNQLRDREVFVQLWQTTPRREQIAAFLLDRRAKQGLVGFRHIFADPDRGIALSLDGSVLTLDLPAKNGKPAQHIAFRRF